MVDQQAFILHPSWLQVGWDLWQRLSHKRDYFLGLPTADLSSMRMLEARYADGVAMSRALLTSLSTESKPLIAHNAVLTFWTEHSDRAFLPSMAGAIPESDDGCIRDVGRWALPTSHEYVRSHLVRVRFIQRTVAERARLHATSLGALDEEEVFADLGEHMLRSGVQAEEVVEQILRFARLLTSARANVSTAPLDVRLGNQPLELPPPAASSIAALNEADATLEDPPLGTHFITEQRWSRFKRLHRFGECPVKPSECLLVEVFTEGPPHVSLYNARCRRCFKDALSPVTTDSSGSSSEPEA